MKREYKKNRSGGVYNLWNKESGIEARHNDRDEGTGLYYNEFKGVWGKYISKKVMKRESGVKMYDFKFFGLEKIRSDFGELKVERLGLFFSLIYNRTLIEEYKENWLGVYFSRDDLKRIIGKDWKLDIGRLYNREVIDVNKRGLKYRGDRSLRYFKLNEGFFNEGFNEIGKVDVKDERFEKSIGEYYRRRNDVRTGVMKKVELTLDKCDLILDDLDVIIDVLFKNRLIEDLFNVESEFVYDADKERILNKLVDMDAYEREYKKGNYRLYECLRSILQNPNIEEKRSYYRIDRDEFGGRLYHLFSNIPKEFRKRITIDGEEVVEIDFNASQPSFLCLLFEKGADFSFTKGVFINHDNSEYVKIAKANNMDLYNYMAGRLGLAKSEDIETARANMKKVFFQLVFGKPKKAIGKKKRKDVCDKLFGKGFYPFLTELADLDLGVELDSKHKNLSYLLQKIESYFLNLVMKEMGDIPFLPIHDALLVKKSDGEQVRSIFNSVIDKLELGSILKIK
jgi:hypothetical protein